MSHDGENMWLIRYFLKKVIEALMNLSFTLKGIPSRKRMMGYVRILPLRRYIKFMKNQDVICGLISI
jgi:hypothetical protein